MRMSNPFFSVIMPAHNAAAYIIKGLNSIRNQSFKDYELFVVCDACTDHTAEIARQYTDKVYEVNFHNPGFTRNVGLDHATGDWVLFCDDDDWFLHEYVFAQLAERLRDTSADLLSFSWIWKRDGYIRNTPENHRSQVCGHAWRRSFISTTRFDSGMFAEDARFFQQLIDKGPVTEFWDMPMYYYNHPRRGSVCWNHDRGIVK